MRPEIIEGTPDYYVNIMKQCWNSDLWCFSFTKNIWRNDGIIKMVDNNTAVSSNIAFCSLPQLNPITKNNIESGYQACKV